MRSAFGQTQIDRMRLTAPPDRNHKPTLILTLSVLNGNNTEHIKVSSSLVAMHVVRKRDLVQSAIAVLLSYIL